MARYPLSSAASVQNAAKTLFANIRFASVDDPISSVVVTSSIPNEGKSTVSLQLAQAIASGGKQVLLVECDMRRRTLANLLGVHAKAGLYAVLAGRVPMGNAIIATQQQNMYFLDVEPQIPNPADLISSKRFYKFMLEAEKAFDYVVYDTPPVGTFVDAAILARQVDATVLVVREGYTKRADLQDAYEQLQKADANVVGVVMNFCRIEKSDYYYAYYNKDGKRVKKASKGSGGGIFGKHGDGEGSVQASRASGGAVPGASRGAGGGRAQSFKVPEVSGSRKSGGSASDGPTPTPTRMRGTGRKQG